MKDETCKISITYTREEDEYEPWDTNVSVDISDGATTSDAISALARVLLVSGYHPNSIISACRNYIEEHEEAEPKGY